MLELASRGGASSSLVDAEFVFLANVSDWFSGLNRTGWAGAIVYQDEIRLTWVGGRVRSFKPGSIIKAQVRPLTHTQNLT